MAVFTIFYFHAPINDVNKVLKREATYNYIVSLNTLKNIIQKQHVIFAILRPVVKSPSSGILKQAIVYLNVKNAAEYLGQNLI